jgi:hypothetical protein
VTHSEARTMSSALADGEGDARGIEALSAHLSGCAECARFGERVRALSALARDLPAEEAPPGLAERVRLNVAVARIARTRARRRSVLAFAAAITVALVAVLGGLPLPTFKLPAAEAARALARIKTFSMEREVVDFKAPDAPRTTIERLWFRSPGFLRVERRTGTAVEIEIQRPGERYVKSTGGAFREIGLPPDVNPVPEPLSPTVPILGRRVGPGPAVAGRPTVRYELSFGTQERRTALVDASSFVVLGAERRTIVSKQTTINGEVVQTKRTISVRYNPPLDDGLFAIPSISPIDKEFRRGGLDALAVPPSAVPEHMSLVIAGSGPLGGAALFADGAFGVLVTVDGPSPDERAVVLRTATVAGRPATLMLSLFDVPRVSFDAGGHLISVAAPLGPEDLVALASALYPPE